MQQLLIHSSREQRVDLCRARSRADEGSVHPLLAGRDGYRPHEEDQDTLRSKGSAQPREIHHIGWRMLPAWDVSNVFGHSDHLIAHQSGVAVA